MYVQRFGPILRHELQDAHLYTPSINPDKSWLFHKSFLIQLELPFIFSVYDRI